MNSYKERVRQRIRQLQPVDIRDLRKFQRNLFGNQNAIQAQEKHHQWLFDLNPFNNGNLPQLWIFRDKGGIIQGQQAGVPYILHAGNKSWRASWGIDLMLSPEYQLRGVGAVLNSEFVQTNEVSTAAGITEAAQKTLHRAGWMDLGTIPLYARPLSAEGIRAGFPHSKVKEYLATLLGWPLLRFLEGCWLLSVYRKRYPSGVH